MAPRDELLFLSHRIPYPPNKGDKIRSYHILRHLCRRYRVHLGSFIDDPADEVHRPSLEALVASTHLVRLHPLRARLASARGLLTGEALSLPYYRDRGLARWLARLRRERPLAGVVVYSSAVAQYVQGPHWQGLTRIIDFVDVDSDKWRQYAEGRHGPMARIYRREACRLGRYERAVAAEFDASLLVSEAEAGLFRELAPESAGRVHAMDNGVDLEYFAPGGHGPDPYPAGARAVVFTGAMDYWANADAVTWFVDSVWPAVREALPQAVFYIVGSRPGEAVRALARQPGVTVTGRVPDVRPYLAHARLAVAPLRIARGVQNKVLEALAMGRPVVASAAAAAGLVEPYPEALHVADAPPAMAEAVMRRLRDRQASEEAEARHWVQSRYDWGAHLQVLDRLLESAREQHKDAVHP